MNAQARSSRLAGTAAMSTWVFAFVCFSVGIIFDRRLDAIGRGDLKQGFSEGIFFVVPFLSTTIVGSALVIRRPHHPVGWLFLGLSVAFSTESIIYGYTAYGAIARPGSLPGAAVVAVIGSSTYLFWIMVLGLILLLTPSGKLTSRLTRLTAWGSIVGCIVGFSVGFVRPYDGDFASYGIIDNPLELSRATGLITTLRWFGIIAVHLGVLVGTVAIVLRFRAARSNERQQLRWVGMAAIPFALSMFGMSIGAVLNDDRLLIVMVACFLSIIPLAVGLSIERHHLYDVDRLVSRAVTWFVLTAAVIVTYVVVVVFVGESIGREKDSAIPAVVATLTAASLVGFLRRGVQDALDRHFNRRRFETLALLRSYARQSSPSMTVEQALRRAANDPSLRVAYWIGERELWVREDGLPIVLAADGVTVQRRGETVCVVTSNPLVVERPTVDAAVSEVLTELENARLRAAIALQLVEVRESRARIVEAQVSERHKIERDLHDGAQQRLLGLAMQLRAVEMSGQPARMRETVARAIDELQLAVRELRALANGLRPAVLVDGGLAAAFDDLGARSPVPLHLETTGERFPAHIEETAWFIACEAVTNAVKHAAPRSVAITTSRIGDRLRLTIEDDGVGGADPMGSGLRGIADRAEVTGGTLTVRPRDNQGTIVIAELPCAS